MSNSPNRSFERIKPGDLRRLTDMAADDLDGLFRRNPQLGACYSDRRLLLCLCQGAARHFVYRDRGVHDFDVWAFFANHPDRVFPYRRHGTADFGASRFGRNPDHGDHFTGRRVDVFGRSLPMIKTDTPIESVQRWLREGKSKSAREIAKQPVVEIWPRVGPVIWEGRP